MKRSVLYYRICLFVFVGIFVCGICGCLVMFHNITVQQSAIYDVNKEISFLEAYIDNCRLVLKQYESKDYIVSKALALGMQVVSEDQIRRIDVRLNE